jgi:hypothetical protein
LSGVKLTKKSSVDKAGKDPKFTATFEGDVDGFDAVLTLTAESEREMYQKIPLIFEKILEIELVDPQKTLDDYQEPEVVEAELVEEPPVLDAEFEELPAGTTPLMLAEGELIILRKPDETIEEYEERKRFIEDDEFRRKREIGYVSARGEGVPITGFKPSVKACSARNCTNLKEEEYGGITRKVCNVNGRIPGNLGKCPDVDKVEVQ